MAKVARLPLPHIPSHEELRASIICSRVKEAYQHAELLRLAMIGASKENGMDFAKDVLIDAAYDLEFELCRLQRDMTNPKAEGEAA